MKNVCEYKRSSWTENCSRIFDDSKMIANLRKFYKNTKKKRKKSKQERPNKTSKKKKNVTMHSKCAFIVDYRGWNKPKSPSV